MLCFLTIDKTKIIIQKKIGEGATSTVYQGKYNDKIVAIKELKDNYHEFKEYFNYELTILQKLKHNLCFIEFFEVTGFLNVLNFLLNGSMATNFLPLIFNS